MTRRAPTNLPAAVETDPKAPVAHVVPPQARLVTVGDAVLGYRSKPTRVGKAPWSRNLQRLAEIERLIEHRRGGDFATIDEEYLRAILPDLLRERDLPGCLPHRRSALAWTTEIFPSLAWDRAESWFLQVEAEIAGPPALRPYRADAIAKMLDVTNEERLTLEMRTIGAVDMNQRQRRNARRAANVAYHRAKRQQAGAEPRIGRRSIERQKPWEAIGASRRTWFNRQKALREAASCTAATATAPNEICTATTATAECSCTATTAVSFEEAIGARRGGANSPTPRHARRPSDETETRPTRKKKNGACVGRQADGPSGEDNPPSAHADDVARPRRLRAGTRPVSEDRPEIALPAQPADARQLSMLAGPQGQDELQIACDAWTSGPMPEPIRVAYIAAKRRRAVRQQDVADRIGISRPQLANAFAGTFGFSAAAAERMKGWLLSADDAPTFEQPFQSGSSSRRPHHRRGGRKRSDPGPAIPTLRLFTLLDGGAEPDRSGERDPGDVEAAACPLSVLCHRPATTAGSGP